MDEIEQKEIKKVVFKYALMGLTIDKKVSGYPIKLYVSIPEVNEYFEGTADMFLQSFKDEYLFACFKSRIVISGIKILGRVRKNEVWTKDDTMFLMNYVKNIVNE